MTWRYRAFGGSLESELALDDLTPDSSGSPPTWRLAVSGTPAPVPEGPPLGSDVVHDTCEVRGFRTGDGFALVFDDTGRFDVSGDGATITWHRPAGASVEAAVADATSRVIALALHAAGTYTLHASAVSINGNGIAFVAPKYHGKSTLCTAMVGAGGRVLSDDTVPVVLKDGAWLAPGLPRFRLWGDAANRLLANDATHEASRKYVVDRLPPERLQMDAVPFRAAYVLNPVPEPPEGGGVSRERLDGVAAVMALLMHAKLGPVLGGAEAPTLLARAAAIAAIVPVYSLYVPRNLGRIGEAARILSSWHGGAEPSTA